MKLTTGILLLGMAAGSAWGQNPDVIDNTRNTLKAVEQKQQMDSNAALAASQGQAANPATPASQPVAGTSAKPVTAKPTQKPATAPAAKPQTTKPTASKPATTQAAKPTATKPATAQAAKPAASKPATTVAATAATSKPAATQAATQATSKPASSAAQTQATTQASTTQNKPGTASTHKATPTLMVVKAPKVWAKPTTTSAKTAAAAKTSAAKQAAPKATAAKKSAAPKQTIAVEDKKNPDAKKETPKAINLTGRRDPFVSPVVNRSMLGSGCSTGKRCLAIDQISLKGVVRAESGMIAVVVNALDKAYFLRENDPVFNGYVVKITGDSIIFKETIQDKLGKPFTREVTKKITTSAA